MLSNMWKKFVRFSDCVPVHLQIFSQRLKSPILTMNTNWNIVDKVPKSTNSKESGSSHPQPTCCCADCDATTKSATSYCNFSHVGLRLISCNYGSCCCFPLRIERISQLNPHWGEKKLSTASCRQNVSFCEHIRTHIQCIELIPFDLRAFHTFSHRRLFSAKKRECVTQN